MKKFIICMMVSLFLISGLGFQAYADESGYYISEDYQTVTIDGNTYSRFNLSLVGADYEYRDDMPFQFTKNQKEQIAGIEWLSSQDELLLEIRIEFKDGSYLTVNFMRDDYKSKYYELTHDPNEQYVIDFEWPNDNTASSGKAEFFKNPVYLDGYKLSRGDYYPVYSVINTGYENIQVYKGLMMIYGGDYYYIDYEEMGIVSREYSLYDYEEVVAHQITEPDFVSRIKECEENYYSDSWGFLYDDDFMNKVSILFLILAFAILPMAALVFTIICAIRTKQVYRKLYTIAGVFAGAELVIFGVIVMLLNL